MMVIERCSENKSAEAYNGRAHVVYGSNGGSPTITGSSSGHAVWQTSNTQTFSNTTSAQAYTE